MRALETLKTVDLIAAEDTRHSGGLLAQKKLLAVHEHNEHRSAEILLERLQAGQSIALITDAGTPGISDPGAVVVDILREAGVPVVPIPGASAVIAALSASGITDNGFRFIGFLPASSSQRKKQLQAMQHDATTLVFYEAPHRVLESVQDMAAVLGAERRITIARELTKTFESFHRCPLGEAHDWLVADANRQRGEFVLMVEAPPPAEDEADAREAERVLRLLLADLPLKQAVKLAVEITGGKKNALYQLALQLNEAQD